VSRNASASSAAIERLVDEAQMKSTLIAYARGIDMVDMSLVRSCYLPGAHEDRGLVAGTVEDFITWVEPHVRSMCTTIHHVSNVTCAIEEQHARSEAYALAIHRMPSSHGPTAFADHLVGARWLDQWTRAEDGQFRIDDRRVVWDWCRIDGLARQWDLPAGTKRSARFPEDASYLHWS
jgi:hypothetical protein